MRSGCKFIPFPNRKGPGRRKRLLRQAGKRSRRNICLVAGDHVNSAANLGLNINANLRRKILAA